MEHGRALHRAQHRRWFSRYSLLAFCALALAACAPRLQTPGPPIIDPSVSEDAIVTPDGARLPLRVWAPTGAPKAVVLAIHGFNDYANGFDDPGQIWAKHGVITYAYDQRGFGGAPHRGYWAGSETYVRDLRLAAELTRARHPGVPFYILGESMGGAITMVAMVSAAPPQADGVILVAPAVWGREFMPIYQTISLWFSAHLVPWMRLTGEGLSIRPSDNIEMLRRFSADPMVIKATRIDAVHGLVNLMDEALNAAPRYAARSLILYGRKDEIVPPAPTFAMLDRLPRADSKQRRVALYDKGYHMLMRDLQAETVIRDVLAWMDKPAAPLPSGTDWQPADEPSDDKQAAPGLLPGVERP